jgi:nucleoside-diphosphate-sugar epimerase
MKILVTGASGLLGTEICRQLKEDKKNVVWAMDNHSRSSTIPPCDKFIEVDLTAGDVAYAELPIDFDYIYHYGAINGTKNFYERPNLVLWNNMIGDFNIFEFAGMNKKLKKLVYASSSEVVSDDPKSPVPENTDITIKNIHNPRWSYRLPKICAENYLANSNLPYVMLRYFNIYGDNSKAGHFLADQIEKIQKGVFEIIGPKETRSFCHVEDAVRATIFCAENVDQELINIGNDKEITISDAAMVIAEALGHKKPKWKTIPGKAGSTATRRPSIAKLKKLMKGYKPMSFEEGVKRIISNIIDKQ